MPIIPKAIILFSIFLRWTFLSINTIFFSFHGNKNSPPSLKGDGNTHWTPRSRLVIPLSWLLVFSNWIHQFANPLPTFTRSRPLDRAGARIILDPPAGQRSTRLRGPLQPSTLRATHRATTPTKRKWMARRLGRVRSKRDKPFDKRDHWGGNNLPPPRGEEDFVVEFLIYFFFLLT